MRTRETYETWDKGRHWTEQATYEGDEQVSVRFLINGVAVSRATWDEERKKAGA